MLELVARHGAFDLTIKAKGDLDVDQHHTVEDIGIAMGEAIQNALGKKRDILRAGYFIMPMDETLAFAAIDLSGRPFCVVKVQIKALRVGDFQTELSQDFFEGFAQAARASVHLRVPYGRSSHHQVEAMFKAFARALRFAVSRDKRLRKVLPSTRDSYEDFLDRLRDQQRQPPSSAPSRDLAQNVFAPPRPRLWPMPKA